MSAPPLPFRLLAIGGHQQATPAAVERVAGAGGGEVAILLRDPRLAPAEVEEWARALLPTCRRHGARLLVHRWVEVAARVEADGAHLPDGTGAPLSQRTVLGPGPLLGLSRHHEAGLHETAGADYAALSPVFPTPGKGRPLGLAALEHACRTAPLPVVALGGITPERAGACRAAGAAAVAAVRAVWEGDPEAGVRALLATGS